MGYLRSAGLGDPSDTEVARSLHQAALAVIAAKNTGNTQAITAAQNAFNSQAGTNAQRIAAIKNVESLPSGFLENLRATLTGAGKWAALGIAALLLLPHIGPALARAGRRPMLLNPGRRRRRRGRRRGR